MKWPKSLKIGAHEVEVIFASSWPEGDQDTLGHAFPEKGQIYIKEGMPETQTFRVLFHEALHFMNGTMSHEVLDSLSEQVSQFLFDNQLLDDD